jgi:YD repeat-containing protein
MSALRAAGDSDVPIPAEKIEFNEDETVTITRGYTDPRTGEFTPERIDKYGPMANGVLGPLIEQVSVFPDGKTITREFTYDRHGRLAKVDILDSDGSLRRTVTYKYDTSGRPHRIEETDENGKTLKITTVSYYSDGSKIVTVTDYSTSPATVTQYRLISVTPPI